MIDLETPLKNLPRIGIKYAKKLEKMEIRTISDFIFHFPFRYDDYSEMIPISEISAGENFTIHGKIASLKNIRTWKRKMYITEALIEDDSGSIRAVWFNQPYLGENLSEGKEIRISGKISQKKDALLPHIDPKKKIDSSLYFSNPSWELASRIPTNTGRLVPVYPETQGLTSRWIRWQIQIFFKLKIPIPDPIPHSILKKLNLPEIEKAVKYIHFPENKNQYALARKRFAFEEMFLMQIKSAQVKLSWKKESSIKIKFDEKLIKTFVSGLPFQLTNAQRKASFEILKDLEKNRPMNRLLNGDVGSGKTIVAAIAALQTVRQGYQVAIMAPTEILAQQHYNKFCELFHDHDFKIGLVTSNSKKIYSASKLPSKTDSSQADIIRSSDIIIGTHSLIQKDIRFSKLALIIIDEQHRFGVAQRAYLQQKTEEISDGIRGKIPHFLTMTATPIPRTLALAFFGNLDLSILDEMPKNRKKIITKIISQNNRDATYDFIRKEIKSGRQAFVILPLVEESKILTEVHPVKSLHGQGVRISGQFNGVKAAVQEHIRLSSEVFPDLKIGLVHGKLKAEKKEKAMLDFKNNHLDILVATAVVEVGIDIPNATIMIIEDADRFGLSQLHQFRGRVGRGEHQSYCFLFTNKHSELSKQRLKALVESEDGFKIAEKDLELRGPGEFFGTRQSGIPDIAMENLANVKLIQISRTEAENLLRSDPSLISHPMLNKAIEKFTSQVHLE
jgi:ATP-dependent DNA helicase RecG